MWERKLKMIIFTKLIKVPSIGYPKELRGTMQNPTILRKNSNVIVEVLCEKCNKKLNVRYFQVSSKENYICRSCFGKIIGLKSGPTGKQSLPILVDNSKMCSYCKTRKAKYYFKKSKTYCCESHWSKCPIKRQERSKNKIPWNKGKKNYLNTEIMNLIKEKLRYNYNQFKEKYPLFCKLEEFYIDNNNQKWVRCNYNKCRKWFIPKDHQFFARIWALEKEDGNDGHFYYCSDECKKLCPSYNLNTTFYNEEPESLYTNSEYHIFKNEVIKRNIKEYGKIMCELCHNDNKDELNIHHIYPQKTNPIMSLDPDNGIVLCGFNSKNKCHLKIGHRDHWCKVNELKNCKKMRE